MKPFNDLRTVSIIFQRQWKNPSVVEMVFDGVTRLNLVPTGENYSSDIFQAYIIFNDGFIYFTQFKNSINQIEEGSNINTWIKSHSLKWRIVDDYLGEDLIYINKI